MRHIEFSTSLVNYFFLLKTGKKLYKNRLKPDETHYYYL